ncbi:MAG: ribonuclease [Gemmatimonadetes bacterium]|nr:ribonuclease [Gemmatimonadota bacterium]
MPLPTNGTARVSVWRAALAALRRVGAGALDFVVRVYTKAGDDNIFFLSGGIAFNIMVAAVPFLLLLVAGFGFVLSWAVPDPAHTTVDYVLRILPPSQAVVGVTIKLVNDIVGRRTRFGILGVVLFVWTSTRLFGTLRSVLKEIFDLQEDRGIIAGKLFDMEMVVVAGSLFLANTGITLALEAIHAFGQRWFARFGWQELPVVQDAWARVLAFAFTFLMFLLIYRFLPARRTPWRVSLVAATFTSVVWELLKGLFAWYVSHVANYANTYGALATLVILVFWIYYSAMVFILGGEVAQVWDLQRIRRRQREMLE